MDVFAQPMEGIVDFTGPSGSNAGLFALPAVFDQKLHAANWVPVGNDVEKAKQVQPIIGTNKGAVGWEVWRYPKNFEDKTKADKPHKTTCSKGEYILMFRPRSVQNNVNAIYGNVSKRHLVRHQTQATPHIPLPGSNQTGVDTGVLSPERLANMGVRDFGNDYEMNLPQNPESSAPQVEADPDAEGSTNT